MGLVKVSKILKHAVENRYGVPAINVFNFESIKWAIMAAEEENMPVIIQYYPGFEIHAALDDLCSMAVKLAGRSIIPVGLHLDHSATFDIAIRGIVAGFPSVMVDGSQLPFEENIALTKSVTDCAKANDIDVEAELGHVGSGMSMNDLTNKDMFTDPDQAVEFVKRTGVGSLAIAIGNGHGNYIKTPELDFDRIEKLKKVLNVSLVMHGGSDIPDNQLVHAVNCGMSKFNIATEYQRAFYNSMKEYIATNDKNSHYFFHALRTIERPCIDFVRDKIRVLNPNHYKL